MKIVEHYMCELCGKEYDKRLDAQHCEEKHKRPVKIHDEYYAPNDALDYPETIDVKMSDGEVITYKRVYRRKND